MHNRNSERIPITRNIKRPFWGIYFPFIQIIIFGLFFAFFSFNLASNNPILLGKWVDISVVVITCLLFIPGVLLFIFIVMMIMVIGKIHPYLDAAFSKFQTISEKISYLLLSFSKILLIPVSIMQMLEQKDKRDFSQKDHVDE